VTWEERISRRSGGIGPSRLNLSAPVPIEVVITGSLLSCLSEVLVVTWVVILINPLLQSARSELANG
jgi:hypothetical protein